MISKLYLAALRNGMDSDISCDDFIKFDNIIDHKIIELRQDSEASRIINIPFDKLKKSDVDYILNL